jgi:hypothetical protein
MRQEHVALKPISKIEQCIKYARFGIQIPATTKKKKPVNKIANNINIMNVLRISFFFPNKFLSDYYKDNNRIYR